MKSGDASQEDRPEPRGVPWRVRLIVGGLVLLALVVVWVANFWLTERFTEATRNRAELRLVLYSGNIQSELQRNSVVPLLLARDPEMIGALEFDEFTHTSQRLISLMSEIGAAEIRLLDVEGRTVAATDRSRIGSDYADTKPFLDAKGAGETVFNVAEREGGGFDYTFSRAVVSNNREIGVVVVSVDLAKFEESWAGFADAVAVTDSADRIILATEPRWRGQDMSAALTLRDAPSAINRALQITADWAQESHDTRLGGEAVLRSEARIPFHDWKIVSFTRYDSVRERVNGVLALIIMGFAIALSLTFYMLSRRAWSESALWQRESAELRQLNARLQREIAAREKVQKDLAVAEQTLEQSSKLAALGEMSAAVSHELNQPLAAMRTYLAGAKLLLQRARPAEALASFQRIDDLIARMGAITRQLKSYARKGGDAFEPVDMRDCVAMALSMMEPQLKTREVTVERTVPQERAMVMGDRLRIEQVIINLLRNALDATKGVASPQIDILLTIGDTATLTVRDNGHGIDEPENLFEPFYTTKEAGEGVGLGLAISSGIVSEHGGRLTARNAQEGGAVFEVQLPVLGGNEMTQAAE